MINYKKNKYTYFDAILNELLQHKNKVTLYDIYKEPDCVRKHLSLHLPVNKNTTNDNYIDAINELSRRNNIRVVINESPYGINGSAYNCTHIKVNCEGVTETGKAIINSGGFKIKHDNNKRYLKYSIITVIVSTIFSTLINILFL